VIRHTPAARSAFQRSLHGEIATWSIDTHLTAALIDLIRVGNWQRGGGKGPRPRPTPRPADKTLKRLSTTELQKDRLQSGVMGTPIPVADMRAWLQRINPTAD
jgi:hypothetical protein